MTNSEALLDLKARGRYGDQVQLETIELAISALEENTKLKAEIDEWKKTVEYHRKKLLEFNNDNADLKAEIERLKSELEQSDRLLLTNADKIRYMSDEELAEFLTRITNDAQLNVGAKCNYQWDEWLQSEVKNGD